MKLCPTRSILLPALYLVASYVTFSEAAQSQNSLSRPFVNANGVNVRCFPQTSCQPCRLALDTDVEDKSCEMTGNHFGIRCVPAESLDHQRAPSPTEFITGEYEVFVSCGKVASVERADYYEFLVCNLAFAVVGILVVFSRTRRIATLQYKNLMARIHRVRDEVWSNG